MKHTYVPPSGPPSATLGICGEQPGVMEIKNRPMPKPFVGPAGKQQDECMAAVGLVRRETYSTNVIKDLDAPLRKYINLDKKGNYTISPNGWTYINELGDELRALPNLNIVVAYGNIALIALTNRVGITKWRGSVLESTFLVKYHGNHQGQTDGEKRVHSVKDPIPTLDTSNRFGLVEPFITILKGQSTVRSIDNPLPTITSNAHLYLCEPFVVNYNGKGTAKSIDKPLATITTKDRFGLVEPVDLDIKFRMLQPKELAAAMSFPENYIFHGTKADQVRQIGNAVPERTSKALCESLLA